MLLWKINTKQTLLLNLFQIRTTHIWGHLEKRKHGLYIKCSISDQGQLPRAAASSSNLSEKRNELLWLDVLNCLPGDTGVDHQRVWATMLCQHNKTKAQSCGRTLCSSSLMWQASGCPADVQLCRPESFTKYCKDPQRIADTYIFLIWSWPNF